MTIKEKVAYLKGLAEGLDISASDDGKLFSSIIDTLGDIANELEELNENALDIGEEIDALSADLADVEELLEDLDLDDEDFDFDYSDEDDDDDYDEYEDEEYDCDCDNCGNGEFTIDVNCPECNADIELNEEDIAKEAVTCPACGKEIELEIDEVNVDDTDTSEE